MTKKQITELTVWYVYIIRTSCNKLYTGISTDVNRRFNEHMHGSKKAAKSLRGKGPLELVFSSEVGNRSEALRIEASIKKLSRGDKDKILVGELDVMNLFH